jgi:outer membrane protein OmpA-like peptidoglycan-associated protein
MLARKGYWLVGLVVIGFGGGVAAGAQQPPSQEPAPPETSAQSAGTTTCRESAMKVEFSFDSDEAAVDPSKMGEVQAWLAGGPGRTVMVKASTDTAGDPAYNEDLSVRRAKAVEQVLINQGVEAARVTAIGEGEAAAIPGEPSKEMRTATVLLCEGPPPPVAAAAPVPTPPAAPAEEPAPAEPPAAPEETPPPAEGPLAEATPAPEVAPVPYPEAPLEEQMEEPTGLARVGLGFALGGGIVDFTDDEARALTDIGGSWDLRAIIGTRLPVALELAYIGQAQNVDVLGIGDSSVLLGNGAEGVLRLQLPTFFVRPYALGGLGWMHYSLTNTGGNSSAMANSDDVLTIPLGLGITLAAPFGGTFDVRGTFKAAYGEDLMTGVYAGTGLEASLHTWGVDARLGWEF